MADEALRQAAIRELARRELERRQSAAAPAPSEQPPQVGPGETYVSSGVEGIPFAGLTSDLLSTGIMSVADPLIRGGGVRPTPEAAAEMKARGIGLPERPQAPGLVELYRQIRDRRRERADAGSAQNPVASALGTGTGVAASLLAPLPKGAQAAQLQKLTAGQRIGKAAKSGAKLGALLGLAEGRADLTTLDPKEYGRAALETGLGGVGGGVIGGALAGVAELARPLAGKVKSYAIERGRKLLTSGADQQSARKEISEEAVQAAFDVGAIRKFGTANKAKARLDEVRQELGSEYARLLDSLEERGVMGPERDAIAKQILEKALHEEANGSKKLATYYRKAAEEALSRPATVAPGETATSGGEAWKTLLRTRPGSSVAAGPRQVERLGLNQSEGIRRATADEVTYGLVENKPMNSALKSVANIYKVANEGAVDEAGARAGGEVAELAGRFRPIKKRLGPIIEASDAARRGAAREAQRTSGGAANALMEAARLAGVGAVSPMAAVADVGFRAGKGAVRSSEAAASMAIAEALERGATGRTFQGLSGKEMELLLQLLARRDGSEAQP